MDRNVKLKLIRNTPLLLEEYRPATQSINPQTFQILSKKFEDFENWKETKKIPRTEFEKLLHGVDDLVDAYLDVYAKKATFYTCILESEFYDFQYFVMKNANGLALLFYRTIETIEF